MAFFSTRLLGFSFQEFVGARSGKLLGGIGRKIDQGQRLSFVIPYNRSQFAPPLFGSRERVHAMKFGIPADTHPHETRHAASPQTATALTPAGHHTALISSGAGASISDGHYVAAALV
ncbi:MAG: hypothetical protein Q8K18_11920 [Burkholderiales bacterium]|nr:hypothetical protein [Burkholderiales bacterium]